MSPPPYFYLFLLTLTLCVCPRPKQPNQPSQTCAKTVHIKDINLPQAGFEHGSIATTPLKIEQQLKPPGHKLRERDKRSAK